MIQSGGIYEIKGWYRLRSRDMALLGAASAPPGAIKHPMTMGTSRVVSKGNGQFTLALSAVADCSQCLPQISLYDVGSKSAFLSVALER
jgi:hypothetical protein